MTLDRKGGVEMSEMKTRLTCTVPEAARLTGIGKNCMYELVRAGRVPTLRVGNKYLVLVDELERWVRESAQNHTDRKSVV